jgi:signal peptidase I
MTETQKKLIKSVTSLFLKAITIVTVVFLVVMFILLPYRQSGNNMFPAIKDGDLCFIYKLDDYHLNDIVLVEYNGKQYLQRIVALEDQTVDFPENGGYTVNGYQPSEEITYETHITNRDRVKFPLRIKDGAAFLLNDFRSDENDGRIYGAVDKSKIKGKVMFLLRRRGF